MASMYAVYHGPDGLCAIARGCTPHAAALRRRCCGRRRRRGRRDVLRHAAGPGARPRRRGRGGRPARRGSTCWRVDDDPVRLSVDETTDAGDLGRVARRSASRRPRAGAASPRPQWADALGAPRDYLTHPVFHAHHSETAMLRYLRRLADRDFALDRGMIPLGSCTMKLNATTEMEAVTWPRVRRPAPVRAARADRAASASWSPS